jgi:hypothetical protein
MSSGTMSSEFNLPILQVTQRGMGGPDAAPVVPVITGATQGSGVSQYTWSLVTQDTLGVRITHTMFFSHWEIDGPVVLNYTGIMGSILGVQITRSQAEVEFAIGGTISAGNLLTINRSDTLSGSTPFFLAVFGT